MSLRRHIIPLVVISLLLAACGSPTSLVVSSSPVASASSSPRLSAEDVQATIAAQVQTTVAAQLAAQPTTTTAPTDTLEPTATPSSVSVAEVPPLPLPAAHQPGAKATTTAALNLRTAAETTYGVLEVIPAGAQVTILSGPFNRSWYKVRYVGRTGYVQGTYLAGDGNGSAKLLIVDISDQWAYAYEDGIQVFAAPTSTGKDGFHTPTGTFTILLKYHTKTLQGRANGESWYQENVPYVLFYTNRGHALHSAPWLAPSVFGSGERRSHGCVNLPVDAAGWFYTWAPVGTTVQVRP